MSMANYPVVLPAVFIIDEEVAKLLGTEGADDAYDILNAEGVQDIQRASDFAGTVSYLNKELLPTGEEMQLDDDIIAERHSADADGSPLLRQGAFLCAKNVVK